MDYIMYISYAHASLAGDVYRETHTKHAFANN
jgi:hypothetical protein